MKSTIIPLILHVPENVDTESVILALMDHAESHGSRIMICESTEWKEADEDHLIFNLNEIPALPKSERQF
jgi:hypothetical protein